ncbi:DUF305 domain-containing protein [Pseudonocardia endophytica]|uniref:Uncharacterized protein (DUF305 family) n=1 Tax=Pseudonocardia endophytica TaxID=401976 RepID=A0A4R1HGZ3_PSEEN|nr:DUF305 domain-containing protein [Pseudonocardia endophytica]TCK21457.1 uncharacterized protein (DUF305 family) [Pseudonocardia endophytica]
MRTTTVAGAAAALAAALVLTACGSSQAPHAPAPQASATSSASTGAHNDADVAFAQGMIPHHEQAVQMSRPAAERGADPQVAGLAARIEQAQAPEIAQMRGFLAAWGAPESAAGMSGMDHSGMGGGMMTDQEMGQLDQARGAVFDRLYLQLMIRHHEGAVQMARTELASGTNPEARALAQRIVDSQQAEIAEMQRLLAA